MEPQSPTQDEASSQDPFESVLNLEDQFYTEGYNLGVADGSRAGRIEGRTFGLEKGFEKFIEMGRLNGRATVWNARLAAKADAPPKLDDSITVPALRGSDRLKKHLHRLQDLTDPETLAMENSEDAVSEFDDRLKDAKAKATLVSKIVGEDEDPAPMDGEASSTRSPTRGVRVKRNEGRKNTGEMEDFSGLPGSKVVK